jgi:hypothetical protein
MFKNFYNRIANILSSTRTTIFLLFSFLIVFLLGQWIPQKKILGELYIQWLEKSPELVSFLDYIGFTDIYSSPLMIFLFSLFFLNLTFVMLKRIPVVKARIGLPEIERTDISVYPNKAVLLLKTIPSMERIRDIFRGYRLYGSERNFIAVRYRYSPAATLLFHLSFFLFLIGGIMTTYTRFSAKIDLAEGESFTGETSQYLPPIKWPRIGSPPSVRFYVERIEPVAVNDVPVDIRVYIRDEKGEQKIISINHPYKKDNTSFVIMHLGIAPLIILYDNIGREIDGAYVKLDVLDGKMGSFILAKRFFNLLFYPDFYQKNGEVGSRSKILKNPVFSIKRRDGNYERVYLRIGDRKRIGDIELHIPELRYWVRFIVVKEKGLSIVYSGFFIITLALVIRLLFYRREIRGYVKEDADGIRLYIGGRSEFYRTLFEDEFREIIKELSPLAEESP